MPAPHPSTQHALAPPTLPGPTPRLALAAFSRAPRAHFLPTLHAALERTGAWMLRSTEPSAGEVHLCFELPLGDAVELYARLMATDLELTRASHLDLTALCTLRRWRPATRLAATVEFALTLRFLDETDRAAALLPRTGTA